MYLGENVPVAICTPRTLTVRAKPVSATIAPTIAASTVVAVEAEYVQNTGGSTPSSSRPESPRIAPRIPPSRGSAQRLPFRCWRRRNLALHVIVLSRPAPLDRGERMSAPDSIAPRRGASCIVRSG